MGDSPQEEREMIDRCGGSYDDLRKLILDATGWYEQERDATDTPAASQPRPEEAPEEAQPEAPAQTPEQAEALYLYGYNDVSDRIPSFYSLPTIIPPNGNPSAQDRVKNPVW